MKFVCLIRLFNLQDVLPLMNVPRSANICSNLLQSSWNGVKPGQLYTFDIEKQEMKIDQETCKTSPGWMLARILCHRALAPPFLSWVHHKSNLFESEWLGWRLTGRNTVWCEPHPFLLTTYFTSSSSACICVQVYKYILHFLCRWRPWPCRLETWKHR